MCEHTFRLPYVVSSALPVLWTAHCRLGGEMMSPAPL